MNDFPAMHCLSALLTVTMFSVLLSCSKKNEEMATPSAPPSNTTAPGNYMYQEYLLHIDKADVGTLAQATFRKDNNLGNKIELTGNASITFNGEHYWSIKNSTYEWAKTGYTGVAFLLTKEDQTTFENTISLSDTSDIDIPVSFTSVSKSSPTLFTWTGKALQTNEEIYVYLTQGSFSSDTVRVSASGSTSVSLTNNLSTFTTGTADLHICRRKELPLIQTDGTAGGKRVAEVAVRKMISVN